MPERSLLHTLFRSADLQEIAKGALVSFVLKVIGSGLFFVLNILIARLLGAEGAGLYFLAFSVVAAGGVIGRAGLDNALLRFVSTHAARSDWDKVSGVHALGMRMATGVSILASVCLFAAAPWMSSALFHKPELGIPLRLMSLSLVFSTLLYLQAECLKGLKRVREAMLVQGAGVPLLALIMIYPFIQAADTAGAVLAYTCATILVAMLGAWLWQQAMHEHQATPHFHVRELLESSRPLFVASILGQAVLPFAPILLLGIWGSSEDVAIFGASNQLAMLISFFLVAINNVVAPKFAELFAKGDMATLGKVARLSAAGITILASPFCAILLFKGDWVLGWYGPRFLAGTDVLAILSLGQLVNLMTGSVGYLLIMSGNEHTFRNLLIMSTVLMLIVSVLLIPTWGSLGAATAAALSVAGLNIGSVWAVHKKLGILAIGWMPFRK